MKLGKYDQRIEFTTEGTTADSYGGYTPTEISVLTTWARIEQLTASKNIEQAQMQLPTIYRVGVQCRDGFLPEVKHLIKWRGKKFKIINSPTVQSVRLNQEWIFDVTSNG